MKNLVYPFLALLGASPSTSAKVEVHEISKNNVELLPGGKEADGIIGDFVLRNNLIECVIGGSAEKTSIVESRTINEIRIIADTRYPIAFRGFGVTARGGLNQFLDYSRSVGCHSNRASVRRVKLHRRVDSKKREDGCR